MHKNTKTHHTIKHKVLNAAVLAIIISVIGVGSFYFFDLNKYETSDDAQVQQLISPVNTRVPGYIKEIRFTEFQKVKEGDTLLIIDPSDFLIQKELAEAGLLDAYAGKKVSYSGVSMVENSIATSQAQIDEVKAQLWNTEKNFKRYEVLLGQEAVTQQQFDEVRSNYEALKAKLKALKTMKTSSSLSVNEASDKLKINDASIKRAQANLKLAGQNLKYTVITAPCDGTVGRKNIIVGQFLNAGQQVITVVDNHQKWITVNFREKQIKSISEEKDVRITIDGVPDKEFRGKIQSLAMATGAAFSLVPTDNATGNFVKVQQRIPVRVEFTKDNSEKDLQLLRTGMNAEVKVLK
jgi:membrane fusion protein (multidrug efflux system)